MQIVTQKIAPCLWFDSEAEEAAKFYVSVFKNSKINTVARYPDEGQEIHGKQYHDDANRDRPQHHTDIEFRHASRLPRRTSRDCDHAADPSESSNVRSTSRMSLAGPGGQLSLS